MWLLRRCAIAIVFMVTLGAFVPNQANAGLVSTDWKLQGDGQLTLDMATGLEWLDFAQTINRSYRDVSAQLTGSGEFIGFRYANYQDIRVFLTDAGVIYPEYSSIQPANIYPISRIFDLMGRPYVIGNVVFDFVLAMFVDDYFEATYPDHHPATLLRNEPPYVGYSQIYGSGMGDDDAQLAVASFLIRDIPIPVPEPSTPLLVASGLVMMWRMRHRQ